MFFKSTILSPPNPPLSPFGRLGGRGGILDNLNIAKAIPIKDIEKALNIYKANNNNSILATKNNLCHYLAGLLEGDGHISIPALGNTTLNRVLNPVSYTHLTLPTTERV